MPSSRPQRPNILKKQDEISNPDNIMRAVIAVQNRLKYPGSDSWHQVSTNRGILFKMIRREWCRITGWPMKEFPASEDSLIHSYYTAYRKLNYRDDNELTSYLGVQKNEEKERKAIAREMRKAELESQ